MSKKPYNGHESWTAWNVSLWINNDEGNYSAAVDAVRTSKDKDRAAVKLLKILGGKTPDGARYSHHTVKLAIADIT